ncbi:hypothetical protein KAU11_08475 [Candidatus Babeliales bacterium]|nr:hypothetical protein [Candidatus Babeliales bacterium]
MQHEEEKQQPELIVIKEKLVNKAADKIEKNPWVLLIGGVLLYLFLK